MEAAIDETIRKVALLGNHLPRHCGIATFTSDLTRALSVQFEAIDFFVVAMNDRPTYAYPDRVRFEVAERDLSAYRRAADFLNVNEVDIVLLQHEYGIFGGKAGSHILSLLRELRMPIVTTLHTILAAPNPEQRSTLNQICELSARVVVMSAQSKGLLQSVHGVPNEKIDFIPHGIPSIPKAEPRKNKLGLEGKFTLLTFGLLSEDKGIESVIDALPAIVKRVPNAVYVVLGATHPHVKEQRGEAYRMMLKNRAVALGVDANIIFHDRFVSHAELVEFLVAADVYITPYLNAEQSTSGTLAYAIGCGKAVISTPYVYAKELLAEGRGILVPVKSPQIIADEVISLFEDEPKRRGFSERALAYGTRMAWPTVAASYLDTFTRAQSEQSTRLRHLFQAKTIAERPLELPELNLDHTRALTDDTAILQHALFDVPRYDDGYCLDDNARALLLMTLLEDAGEAEGKAVHALSSRYLAFVCHAFNAELGRFRNFMSYARKFTETIGSEDSHGRALWALGTLIGRASDAGHKSLAFGLFHQALPAVTAFKSPRAWSFALLGIDEYLRAFEGERTVQQVRATLAERLLALFTQVSGPEWPWFENSLTYSNARLSQALLISSIRVDNAQMKAAALASLEWLATLQQTAEGYFAPIGSNGFFHRGQEKALFDQQPVEAAAMVSACIEAHRVTDEAKWAERAVRAFNWFLGQNQLQLALYNPATGSCRDGLHVDRINENQGAESTLSFLLALVEMRAFSALHRVPTPPVSAPRHLQTHHASAISPNNRSPGLHT